MLRRTTAEMTAYMVTKIVVLDSLLAFSLNIQATLLICLSSVSRPDVIIRSSCSACLNDATNPNSSGSPSMHHSEELFGNCLNYVPSSVSSWFCLACVNVEFNMFSSVFEYRVSCLNEYARHKLVTSISNVCVVLPLSS